MTGRDLSPRRLPRRRPWHPSLNISMPIQWGAGLHGLRWRSAAESAWRSFIPPRQNRANLPSKQGQGCPIPCPLIAVGAQPCLVGCRCSRVAAGCVSYQFGRVRIVDDRPRVRLWFGFGAGPPQAEQKVRGTFCKRRRPRQLLKTEGSP